MNGSRVGSGGGISWAGLAVGPACWAISTQANYALVDWACKHQRNPVPAIAACLALASFASGYSSWLAWRRHEGPGRAVPEQDGHPRNLLSGIGVASAALFGTVIMMQGLAALILNACIR
jgi:hypothetical protein